MMITRSGTGKGRTVSVRRIEPRSTFRPRLHRWTDKENTFRATVRGLRATLATGVAPVRSRPFSYLRGIETGNERMVDQTGIEPVTS